MPPKKTQNPKKSPTISATNHRRTLLEPGKKIQRALPKEKLEPRPLFKSPHTPAVKATVPEKVLAKAYEETLRYLHGCQQEGEALRKARRQQAPGAIEPGFHLDPWQEDAVQALMAGANVIVDAPTTAGKTRVVEAYLQEHIHDAGFRACYTCPVKSLSNDKLKEFRQKYGKEKVGIATGDFKENLGAPLVVATLESYRNSLLGVEPDLERNLVIFDEYHYLQDEGRGSAWEESIILTPPESQMLLLSASIANAHEFADWLEHLTGRPSILIELAKRPVPLVDLVWLDGRWYHAPSLQAHLQLPGDRNIAFFY